ncbi:MAG: hypothetical protein IT314_04920 [Anaerolineales bacterium]|nr:hypothetical protein [Anaerolineales bacterium]
MNLIGFLLLAMMIISLWLFPSAAPILAIVFLLFSFAIAVVSIFKKHREIYLQGKITRGMFVRNVSVEILGILLAMALAGLLGRYLAQIAMKQIHDVLIEFIVGITVGLLAGMGVGVLVEAHMGTVSKNFSRRIAAAILDAKKTPIHDGQRNRGRAITRASEARCRFEEFSLRNLLSAQQYWVQ